ncbi:alpha/beta fold hydrolase [Rhodococcus sp. NPDC058521]|uniref:alpha/beta fold hydrolase n=1 Tax=Rhodococcus sp. NPDC058521 TaxID=3346536 RepID=UPI003667E3AF
MSYAYEPERRTADSEPTWFTSALNADVDRGAVDVAGAEVHFRAWGPSGSPGIVLIHGGAAHSRWWDHVAPMLAQDRRVVALDLSGHGDSGRREKYGLEQWAEESLAVAGPAGITGAPMFVGHSMGGLVSFAAARLFGEDLAGVQLVDSPVRARTPEEEDARAKRQFAPSKPYSSADRALAHFRLVPPQETALPYVLDHIARTSMREQEGAWTWKFDPAFFYRGGSEHLGADDPRCRIAYLRAEHGIVSEEMVDDMRRRFGPSALFAEIPAAGHHAMIDQPLALVTGIRTVLAAWESEDRVAGLA